MGKKKCNFCKSWDRSSNKWGRCLGSEGIRHWKKEVKAPVMTAIHHVCDNFDPINPKYYA